VNQRAGMGRMRTIAAVARFLGVEPGEVRELIEGPEALPASKLPGRVRARWRVFLPDLHAWLCARPGSDRPGMACYERFVEEFERAQGKEAGK